MAQTRQRDAGPRWATAQHAADAHELVQARRGRTLNIAAAVPPTYGVCPPDDPADKAEPRWACPQHGEPHSHCAHCGEVVKGSAEAAGVRAHAVAGAQQAKHPSTGEPLRLLVTHCKDCLDGADCAEGSGAPGYCEPAGFDPRRAEVLYGGLPLLVPVLKRIVLAGVAFYTVTLAAFVSSQGQGTANLQGGTGAYQPAGDTTLGHGYNGGDVSIYTGSAPADANAAAAGTVLVRAPFANPAFAAPTAALPPVLLATIPSSTILATGTMGYGRQRAQGDDDALSTTERRAQFTVAASDSPDLLVNSTAAVGGGSFVFSTYGIAAN